MATLEQIQEKMKRLQAQAEAIIATKAQKAVDQIREIMIKHGLTTADIEAQAKARRERVRGASVRAARKEAKPAATKGKLPPKYRNPKTGETWSGHARPPVWIKDVKDRSKFLIAGAAAGVAAGAGAIAKKAAVKKVAVKKMAAKKAGVKAAGAKKVAAKKGTAKKAAAKPAAKKAPVKRAAVKQVVAKKAVGAKRGPRAAKVAVSNAAAPAADAAQS